LPGREGAGRPDAHSHRAPGRCAAPRRARAYARGRRFPRFARTMKILPLVFALALLAAGTAHGRSATTCTWGATLSRVGCLAPYTHCTTVRRAAYRRHAYACVGGYLQYDYSQLRRRPVRRPGCTLTSKDGTLKRNGFASMPAWGSPASPFTPNRSLVAPVGYDTGYYAEY